MNIVYTVADDKHRWEVYQSEGSSRYNLRKVNIKSGKAKFMRGYRTVEEARHAADGARGLAQPIRKMI